MFKMFIMYATFMMVAPDDFATLEACQAKANEIAAQDAADFKYLGEMPDYVGCTDAELLEPNGTLI